LTLTDIGVLLGHFNIPGARAHTIQISTEEAKKTLQHVEEEVLSAVRLARGKDEGLPCVVVGGGAPLLRNLGFLLPESYGFANAYGAALAEIAGTIDTVRSLEKRDEVMEEMKSKACALAISKGADSATTRITNLSIIPYGYSKELLARIIVTASGKRRRHVEAADN
jgi:hypothetical protein